MTIHDAVVNWLLESALEKEPLSAKASLEFKSFHQNLLHLHVSYTKDEARAQPISHSRACTQGKTSDAAIVWTARALLDGART